MFGTFLKFSRFLFLPSRVIAFALFRDWKAMNQADFHCTVEPVTSPGVRGLVLASLIAALIIADCCFELGIHVGGTICCGTPPDTPKKTVLIGRIVIFVVFCWASAQRIWFIRTMKDYTNTCKPFQLIWSFRFSGNLFGL